MNSILASVYGGAPAEPTLDEMSKLAAEAVGQSLAQNGININDLSEEDLNALAAQVAGGDGAAGAPQMPPQAAAQAPAPEMGGAGEPSEEELVQAIVNDPELLEQLLQQDPELAQAIAQAVGAHEGGGAPEMGGAAPEATMGGMPPQGAAHEAPPMAKADAAQYAEMEKEAARQVAAADFTGRIMAHAMDDELNKIAAARAAGYTPVPPAGYGEPTYQEKIAAIMNAGQPQVDPTEVLRVKIGQAVINKIQEEEYAAAQRQAYIQASVRQAFGR